MFIQRLVLVSVLALASVTVVEAASRPAHTFVSNGSFTLSGKPIDDGSIPPNPLTGWQVAYGKPRIVFEAGCDGDPDPGYITMSGTGGAIRQPVSLRKGARYTVSLCTRYGKSKIATAQVELYASTTPFDSPHGPKTSELMVAATYKAAGKWQKVQFEFAPSRDSTYLTISTSNGLAGSWVDIDDVSIVLAKTEVAPLFNADAPGAIPGQYLVILKGTDVDAVRNAIRDPAAKVLYEFKSGLVIRCRPETLKKIRRDRHVLWVEVDQKITSTSSPWTAPSTGIDRIDQRVLPLNNAFQSTETGLGVHVYVFDTGIRTTHSEFRAAAASRAFGADDCDGHGTHVAAAVGGRHYGIAKEVTLHSVPVVRCGGESSVGDLIREVDSFTASLGDNHGPTVANLSIIAGGRSEALEKSINASIARGVTYVVAAGNRADDACHYSPAAIPNAITVGATTITASKPLDDTRFILSNHGPCLDLFAPGAGILSASIKDNESTAVRSGTSMAAAYVTGVAALVLERYPQATPAEVWNTIHDNNNVHPGTPNWEGVGSKEPGSPDELLHWGPSTTNATTAAGTTPP